MSDPYFPSMPSPDPTPTPALPEGKPVIRLLLVDDHEDTNRSLKLLLKRRGYQPETATDIATALMLADEQDFDVLISDMSLPDGTGLDLLRQMRKPPRHGGIIVSGYNADEDIARSKAAGYLEHLSKPVDVNVLDAVIQRLIVPVPEATTNEDAAT